VQEFNNDGSPDLAVVFQQSGQSFVKVFLGNGDGTFQDTAAIRVDDVTVSLAAADFNGDGRLDLVTTSRFGNVDVLLGNGDGTFQDPVAIHVSSDITAVAVGDFFGDGKQDVAVANLGHLGASSSVSVLRGNGDGTFQAPLNFQLGVAESVALAAGDFFGDGKLSLAVDNSLADTVSVLRGNGDGTFQAPVNFLAGAQGTGFASLVVGDFNSDGRPDLAVTNSVTDDVSVLLNTAPPPSTAAPVATATSLAADTSSAVFGQPVTLTASVAAVTTPTGPSFGTPTGTVTFFDGDTVLSEVALDPNGQATLTVSLDVGAHSLTASFAGIAPFTASSSAALGETVAQAGTTTALAVDDSEGPSIVFLTATVAPVAPGAGLPTGTVTFFDGTTVLGTGSLDANGQAFFFVELLAPGPHSLSASYSGDGNFLASTSATVTETVNQPAATATALITSVNPAVFSQPVTLTATVTAVTTPTGPSFGTPAGIVTFFDGDTVLGSATLDAAGRATLTVSLGVGTHSLTASFGATSAFAASSSAAVTETVNTTAATTALVASANPVARGQTVTFTATVRGPLGTGTPTGTVTFLDGNTVLATVALDATGKARLRGRFSVAGRHTIRAVYSGDSQFAASSQSLTEQVN
jgi:hypothetical protein